MKQTILILLITWLAVTAFAVNWQYQTGEGEVDSSDEAIEKRDSDEDLFSYIFNTLILKNSIPSKTNKQHLEIETAPVFTGYSDVRIPGDTGTLFSLSEDLKADLTPAFRMRWSKRLGEKHNISLLIAPLHVVSKGKIDREVNFAGESFPADTDLKGTYWFNSFRLTYRYDFLQNYKNELGIGFTAKIREAGIMLEGGGQKGKKTNVGFVPIINFRYHRYLGEKWAFLLEGDALAAPQGRAEDVFVGFNYKAADWAKLKLGYRLLEGGADNDEVYNFALFHYAVLGINFGN